MRPLRPRRGPRLVAVGLRLLFGARVVPAYGRGHFTPFAGTRGSTTVDVTGASGAVLTLDGATSKVTLSP